MKIELLKPQKNLGSKGDIIEVSDGYATSVLLPRGIARIATPSIQKAAQRHQQKHNQQQQIALQKAQNIAKKLKGKSISLSYPSQDETLFSAVPEADIVRALKEQLQIHLPQKTQLSYAKIKTIGDHRITAKLPGNLQAHFTLTISNL